jgi:hypothetical protein
MASSLPTALALNDTLISISDTAERSRQLLLCCQENFAEESRCIAGDQLSRFNLWASNIGVFSSPQTCLDYRLRTAPTAKAAVEGNLEILCTQLLSGEISHLVVCRRKETFSYSVLTTPTSPFRTGRPCRRSPRWIR